MCALINGCKDIGNGGRGGGGGGGQGRAIHCFMLGLSLNNRYS